MSDQIPDYILKTYKAAFTYWIKDPKAKFVHPEYIKPPHPRDCVYCGGLGRLTVFVATDGPFRDPTMGTYTAYFVDESSKTKTQDEYHMNYVSRWLGEWYLGKFEAALCPACHGTRRNPDYVEKPIRKHEVDISGIVKETPKIEVEEMDYSDH